MHTATATDIITTLEALHPRMTSDGYTVAPLAVHFVARGELGRGVHARYSPNGVRNITVAGLEDMTDAFALDTMIHEYAHAVLDAAAHQWVVKCPRFIKTAGHCSHFAAMHKLIAREWKAAA